MSAYSEKRPRGAMTGNEEETARVSKRQRISLSGSHAAGVDDGKAALMVHNFGEGTWARFQHRLMVVVYELLDKNRRFRHSHPGEYMAIFEATREDAVSGACVARPRCVNLRRTG